MSDLGNRAIFAKNLQFYMQKFDKSRTDICKDLGFAYTTFTSWEKGVNYPRIDKIEMIANYFGIEKSDLIEDKESTPDGPPRTQPLRGVRIPILGKVVAGIPMEAIENIEGWEEITPKLAASGEYFALKIKGESMEPKLHEGDIVIVRKQNDVDSGDTAIVLVNGDEATVKQIKKTDEGIMLVGLNLNVYQPHFYTKKQIESFPIQIIGKVVESRHTW